MTGPARSAVLQSVVDLYDTMHRRLHDAMTAPVGDGGLAAEVTPLLAAEARFLDARAFGHWLGLLAGDCHLWIPISPHDHPGRDQALIFDDKRRLHERCQHFADRQAWAITAPEPTTIRHLGTIEAREAHGEVLATAPITLLHVRRGPAVKLSGRQIVSLARQDGGLAITSKILVLPELMLGSSHLGWII